MQPWKAFKYGLFAMVGLTAFILFAGTASSKLKDYGPLPEFPETGKSAWINSKPLKAADLKGQVLLIEVWTTV